MSKKKDDFEFNWDDDASFDSELDKFDGDVGEFYGDDVDDAEKNRSPVTKKLKSIRSTISDAGGAVLSGAGVGIGKAVEKHVPEIHEAYNTGTYLLSEAEQLRNEARESVMPFWNETKRTLRKLSQQLEGQMPFGLDKKILKLIGEEDRDQEYEQPSKEQLRQEKMSENINKIFELQMQKSVEQQRDAILNRTLDRRVSNRHHRENIDVMSSIATHVSYQHAFTSSVFTAYLKKDLELKYKHYYVASDTLDVFKNYSKSIETRLDAIITNTALPDTDKVHMSERVLGNMKNEFANSINTKLSNYFSDARKNILEKIKESVDWASMLTGMLDTQATMLEQQNDDMFAMMGGNKFKESSVLTRNGLIGLGLNWFGSKLGNLGLNKMLSWLPKTFRESLKTYTRGGGKEGLALFLDDYKNGRIGEGGFFAELLDELLPDLFKNNNVLYNKSDVLKDEGAKFTGRFITTVEKIIPGYLAQQTRYLKMLLTHKNEEAEYWDFEQNRFLTESAHAKMALEPWQDEEMQKGYHSVRYSELQTALRKKYDKTPLSKEYYNKEKQSLKADRLLIDRVLANLENSSTYINIDESTIRTLQEFLSAMNRGDDKAIDNIYKDNDFIKIAFQGFNSPQKIKDVTSFWLRYFLEPGENLNNMNARISDYNVETINQLMVSHRRSARNEYIHNQIAHNINNEDKWFLDKYYGERDANGNLVTNMNPMLNMLYGYTGEVDEKSEEDIEKYNSSFQSAEFDKKYKQKPFISRLASKLGETISQVPFRNLADSVIGDSYIGIRSFFSSKANKDATRKKAKQEWDHLADSVSGIIEKTGDIMSDVGDSISNFFARANVRTQRGMLLAASVATRNNVFECIADLILPENDDGVITPVNPNSVTPGAWIDALMSCNDYTGIIEVLDANTKYADLLRTILPKTIHEIINLIARMYDDEAKEFDNKFDPLEELHDAYDKYDENPKKRHDAYKKTLDKLTEFWKKRMEAYSGSSGRLTESAINNLRTKASKTEHYQRLIDKMLHSKKYSYTRKNKAGISERVVRKQYRGIMDAFRRKLSESHEAYERLSARDSARTAMEAVAEAAAFSTEPNSIISKEDAHNSTAIDIQKHQLSYLEKISASLDNFYLAFIDPQHRKNELDYITKKRDADQAAMENTLQNNGFFNRLSFSAIKDGPLKEKIRERADQMYAEQIDPLYRFKQRLREERNNKLFIDAVDRLVTWKNNKSIRFYLRSLANIIVTRYGDTIKNGGSFGMYELIRYWMTDILGESEKYLNTKKHEIAFEDDKIKIPVQKAGKRFDYNAARVEFTKAIFEKVLEIFWLDDNARTTAIGRDNALVIEALRNVLDTDFTAYIRSFIDSPVFNKLADRLLRNKVTKDNELTSEEKAEMNKARALATSTGEYKLTSEGYDTALKNYYQRQHSLSGKAHRDYRTKDENINDYNDKFITLYNTARTGLRDIEQSTQYVNMQKLQGELDKIDKALAKNHDKPKKLEELQKQHDAKLKEIEEARGVKYGDSTYGEAYDTIRSKVDKRLEYTLGHGRREYLLKILDTLIHNKDVSQLRSLYDAAVRKGDTRLAYAIARASRMNGIDLNEGLSGQKYGRAKTKKKYAKGENFDYDGLLNQVDDSLKTVYARYQRGDIKRKRDLDYEKRKIVQNAFAGIDLTDINELNDALVLGSPASPEVGFALSRTSKLLRVKKLVAWAPIIDVTWYFKKYYEIPDTIKIIDPQISDVEIKYSVEHPDAVMVPLEIQKRTGIKSNFSYNSNGELEFHPVLLSDQPDTTESLKLIQSTKFDYEQEDYWGTLEELREDDGSYVYTDPTTPNGGVVVLVPNKPLDQLILTVGHELGHSLAKYGTALGKGGNSAHAGRGRYTEKRADIYGLNSYLLGIANKSNKEELTTTLLNHLKHGLAVDEYEGGNKWDNRWRLDLMRRYLRMRKHKGDPLYADLDDKALQPQFRNNYAKGDNISFSLPIDQYGGYVDQPTEILGGSGIAGEAGGETILPHKFNERFKELLYRCVKDTVSENMARRILGMLNPSDATQDRLGLYLSDNEKTKFAKGGNVSSKGVVPSDNYTRKYTANTTKNILLNIMESNEAIYKKLGDGLLVVDLAAALDKLKNTELLNKLKSLNIGTKIKDFIFGAWKTGKSFGRKVFDFTVGNAGSFSRHLLTNKTCDVYLKSEIEGEVHGPKKIEESELENGTIFADKECTKPIYSVADIHPPVYRKVMNKKGKEVVKEAITAKEGKRGLVDVEGRPLLRFGGKIGRFLRNVAAVPFNAIFNHKNLDRLKGLGSSIASGFRSGIDGLFDAYCDVYTTKNLKKPLVYGESIKEGRLVRVLENGKTKVVPTVFDIDGPCWLLIDDPDNPGKRKLGNEVINEKHIAAGLCHKDGSPITSSKIAKATSMLRRAAGAVGSGVASLVGGAFNIGTTAIGWIWQKGTQAAGWVKDRIKDAFTAKDPYIDVFILKDGKLVQVISGEDLRTNKATLKYCFRDDKGNYTPVLSAYGIDKPVYTMVGKKGQALKRPRCVISKEDIDNGVFDINGNKLTRWAGRSLAGKIGTAGLGLVKFGWNKIKGLGKGLWHMGKTLVSGLGAMLGDGAAGVVNVITNAWNSTIDLFKNSIVSRKDLQEIVGDRLLDIYGLLYKYMPRKDPNDKDNDGDVDGSWEDYEQKRKEREAKRKEKKSTDAESGKAEHKSWFSGLFDGFKKNNGTEDDEGILDTLMDIAMFKWMWSGGKGGAEEAVKKAPWYKRLWPFGKRAGAAESPEAFRARMAADRAMKREAILNGTATAGNSAAKKAPWYKRLWPFGKGAAARAESVANAAGSKAGWFRRGLGATGRGLSYLWNGAKSAVPYLWSHGGRTLAKTLALPGKFVFTKALPIAGKALGTVLKAPISVASGLGKFAAKRIAAVAGANAVPVIGQLISLGMLAWTAYDVVKMVSTDDPKIAGLRPGRFKAYGIQTKYWEAVEDLETDTYAEFKRGNSAGVDNNRLRQFGYKVDFLDDGDLSLGGDKIEYLRMWYKTKFIPVYNVFTNALVAVGNLNPNEQPKGTDISDELWPVLQKALADGFEKVNKGDIATIKLDKKSYDLWHSRKLLKEREEGLASSKYSNKDLTDGSSTEAISKYTGNMSDHLSYAWNELKHGNVLNALWSTGKGLFAGVAKLGAFAWDLVSGGLLKGIWDGAVGNVSNNEKAWDEVRFKLYGTEKTNGVTEREYKNIVNCVKDLETTQVHVIDNEESVIIDDLEELAEKIFTEKERQKVYMKVLSSGIPVKGLSKDLKAEAKSFVISWYKRIFIPIFTLYADIVRMACGAKPGDNIIVDDIPADQRAPVLKEFERRGKALLATNIDVDILRLSTYGLFKHLVLRSEEDKAELAKDSNGMLDKDSDQLTFTDKLSHNLNEAGNDLSRAWAARNRPGKALSYLVKGIGKGAWALLKTAGTSMGQSLSDFLHGSLNEHKWESRFFDYGFTSRAGSSEVFKDENLKSMEEFEQEVADVWFEDGLDARPDEKYFVKIAVNSGFIEECCKKLFGNSAGLSEASIDKLNRGFWSTVARSAAYFVPVAGTALAISDASTANISTLAGLRKVLMSSLLSKVPDGEDKEKTKADWERKISDMITYLDFWYKARFVPVFDAFLNVVMLYGVKPDDIDVDDIDPKERDKAYTEYQQAVMPILKKDQTNVYSLSAAGLSAYLQKLDEFRKDASDGVINNTGNPLAKYYKEKENEYISNTLATVLNNANALMDTESQKNLGRALNKENLQIDNELADASLMSKYAASDILKQLGLEEYGKKGTSESIFGLLMQITTGANNYDKDGEARWYWSNKKLGTCFEEFVKGIHNVLYGTKPDELKKYLDDYISACLYSGIMGYKSYQSQRELNIDLYIDLLKRNVKVAAPDDTWTYQFFGHWLAYKFVPYYMYFVSLINKANGDDMSAIPDIGKLSIAHKNYVIDKLSKIPSKGLVESKYKKLCINYPALGHYVTELVTGTTGANADLSAQRARRASMSRADMQKEADEKVRQALGINLNTRSTRNPEKRMYDSIDGYAGGSSVSDLVYDEIQLARAGSMVHIKGAQRNGRVCTEEERKEIFDFLVNELSLTAEQAAGVMGNMAVESAGISPDTINGTGATGICQWRGERLRGGDTYKGLLPFARERGLDPLALQTQLQYLKWELENVPYERDRFNEYVRSVKTDPLHPEKAVAAAAKGFRVGFERCGEHEAHDDKRIGNAIAFMRKFAPRSTPSYIPDGTGIANADNSTRGLLSGVSTNGSHGSLAGLVTKNGKPGDIDVEHLNSTFAERMSAAIDAYKKQVPGGKVYVNSGFRDDKKQAELWWRKYKLGDPTLTGGVNRPEKDTTITINGESHTVKHGNTKSRHKSGTALDISAKTPSRDVLASIAKGYGITRPYSDEPWHFQLSGEVGDPVIDGFGDSIRDGYDVATAQASARIKGMLANKPKPGASIIASTTAEGNNANIRTLSSMHNNITSANSGNAPVVSELKLISSILTAFKDDVGGFIKLLASVMGSGKEQQKTTATRTVTVGGEKIDASVIEELGNRLLEYLGSMNLLQSGKPAHKATPSTRNSHLSDYPLNVSKARA